MVRYIIRRLILVVVIMAIVLVVTFLIFFIIPKLTGENPAVLFSGKGATPGAVHATTIKLGLNKPVGTQLWLYVKGIFVGRHFNYGADQTYCPVPCLGYSFKNGAAVWPTILSDLPVTVSLAIGAAILWLISGVSIGVLSALRRGSFVDRLSMGLALAGVSLPVYFTGELLLYVFEFKLHIWSNVQYVGITANPISWAENLVLPWIALAFLYAALYARLTRASMLETMSEDYVRTARAKGLSERRVIFRHALRSAVTPIVTIFGLDLGGLLGGAILTEQTFSMTGIGRLAISAIGDQDLPVIIGVTLFAAFFIVMANLVVDLLYAVVDPRVRYS